MLLYFVVKYFVFHEDRLVKIFRTVMKENSWKNCICLQMKHARYIPFLPSLGCVPFDIKRNYIEMETL